MGREYVGHVHLIKTAYREQEDDRKQSRTEGRPGADGTDYQFLSSGGANAT